MNTFKLFMKRNYKVILLLIGVSALLWSFMPKQQKDTPEKDQLLLELVTYILENTHYNPAKIDDKFSATVYKEYLKALDPMKRYFLQSDIDEFSKYEYLIDDMIQLKELSFFDLTYERITQRMNEAKGIYTEVLEQPFEFESDDVLNADYDNIGYAKDAEELKERWKKLLKLNVLSTITDNLKIQEGKVEEEEEFDEFGEPIIKEEKKTDKKAKDKKPVEKKSFEQLEKEARESALKSYDEVFEFIKDLERKDWFAIYLNSIVERFDPHTFYFAPEDKEKFDASMSGSFEGIGAVLRKKSEGVEINELVPGGPAWRGKEIETGDIILKVGQTKDEEPIDIVGMRLDNVVKLIKGKKNTTVFLTIKKIDGTIKVIPVMREVIEMEETYAKSSVIQDGDKKYGVIHLPKFYIDFENKDSRNAFTDVEKEIKELKQQNIDGIIMDLRNNGGGSLETVIKMVGLFSKEGPVVQVKSSRGKQKVLDDKDTPIVWEGPLVVLVNNFSASASEIFAAAIQDYKRGIIIGSKHTYGKGTVQNLITLNDLLRKQPYGDLGALKVTLQKFYRINGGSTQREGVLSDIVLPDRYSYIDMGERDMDNAMPWDKIERATYTPYNNDFSAVIKSSKERIALNEQFKLIDENAQWINERKDEKEVPLSLEKYRAKQKEVEEKAKKFKAISKYKNELKFTSLPSELARIKNDTILESKRDRWHEMLNGDVYIEEGVKILKDLDTKKIYKVSGDKNNVSSKL
ncbi:carboxy terminal-processing peptidase [Myroides odoratimimus]|uniref:C-terminal processing peptidase n=1 Tax=Myroides odoratimimus CIP 101113 TaxID=883154 RepID=A0AAV3F6G3_9FLAO|nr:carboxy terminal-processing peptidase [Myroides odoratimimus]EHO14598.1 C-terminal processing peptidase [Myroides odoratimimus CIP 101113]MCA4793977.1 carboxy terminal-processing peptidase [Myroides odoratimimus]MCA4807147.1 carboxy terminal-processing peptidase [Myroides odoratimimus]MCA4821237.1 carboxy terminal-processing peptidase [Myroides odoratimimus]MDM1059968.1 carboxy terminal-processing peptidase [Myroides odoratimimus]